MQEISSFLASYQQIHNSLKRDLVSKYFLVIFRVDRDYLVNLTQ